MERASAQRWEIDQDEFGRPLIRHRHPTKTVSAYVAKDPTGSGTRAAQNARSAFGCLSPPIGLAPGPSRRYGLKHPTASVAPAGVTPAFLAACSVPQWLTCRAIGLADRMVPEPS